MTLVEQCIYRSITELEIAREELFRHSQPGDEEAIKEINSAILELDKALRALLQSEERISYYGP